MRLLKWMAFIHCSQWTRYTRCWCVYPHSQDWWDNFIFDVWDDECWFSEFPNKKEHPIWTCRSPYANNRTWEESSWKAHTTLQVRNFGHMVVSQCRLLPGGVSAIWSWYIHSRRSCYTGLLAEGGRAKRKSPTDPLTWSWAGALLLVSSPARGQVRSE